MLLLRKFLLSLFLFFVFAQSASGGLVESADAPVSSGDVAAFNKALELASQGDRFRDNKKWTESLDAYRRSLAAWKLEEVEAAMSDVQKTVLEIRRNRDMATWLREMGKAYQAEKKYEEAVDCYKKSLELDRQSEAVNALSRLSELFKKEGHEFYRIGKYKEALECYKKSLAIEKNSELESWIPRVESGIKAQASIDEANRLIREANVFYTNRQYKQALERYKASLELYPNDEVSRYVRHIEEIMLQFGN